MSKKGNRIILKNVKEKLNAIRKQKKGEPRTSIPTEEDKDETARI